MFADLGGRFGGMDFQCRSRQRTDPRTGVDPTDLHESNVGLRRTPGATQADASGAITAREKLATC
jgi:hypothetical protein